MYKLVLRLNQGILSTVRSCKFLVLDGMEDSEYVGTERTSAKEVATAFKNGIWALLMPVIILGGIYSGLFTPTEAAAIAVFYGIIVSAFVYPKKRTQRDELCDAIDTVLKQKPKSFDGFVQALADMGFEFKDGKQPAFKGENQKRFIRLRSLGEGYSKEEIQAVISGKNLHKSKGSSAKAPSPKQFQMLIDIQAKMAEGKTVGYEKWAKKFNRKEAARTVILLKEKGLGNYDDLTAHIENLSARFDALSDSIKAAEKRMVEVQALQQHIKNYRNTRQIYIEYRKSGYSKKFFEEHRQEITIHKAAKQAFDELQITKLPSMQSLYEEFHQLAVQKKQDYAEYRQIRKEKEELLIAKRTVETILNIDRQKEQEKEQEKEEKKNFR